jgi:hypothetical protein
MADSNDADTSSEMTGADDPGDSNSSSNSWVNSRWVQGAIVIVALAVIFWVMGRKGSDEDNPQSTPNEDATGDDM